MRIKRIIDISRKIYPGMAVWPGDGNVDITRVSSIKRGNSCNLSSINMGLHTGTHADAPFHFIDDAETMESVDLSGFIGFVKVFEVDCGKAISADHLKELSIEEGDSVFFKTRNSLIPEENGFCKDFIHIDVSGAEYLVKKKIKTVGVDYLSVEGYGSSEHLVHKILLSNRIGIIEGLYLADVKPGRYFFSALPLKICGVDGSPVRAVLLELE